MTHPDTGHRFGWYDVVRFITPLLLALSLFVLNDMRGRLDKIDALALSVAELRAQVQILMQKVRP